MHNESNLNLSLTKKIPVVFDYLQNYDSHLVYKELERYNFKINVISKIMEKCMSFSIKQIKGVIIDCGLALVFIDSIHFVNN